MWSLDTEFKEEQALRGGKEIFRKILEPTREEGGTWRLMKNLETDDLVNEINIMGDTWRGWVIIV